MVEILIVAVLVLWSALVVFKKVFPNTSYSVFLKFSNACQAKGWNSVAKWLKPEMKGGCGGNCACPVSEKEAKKSTASEAVKWK